MNLKHMNINLEKSYIYIYTHALKHHPSSHENLTPGGGGGGMIDDMVT